MNTAELACNFLMCLFVLNSDQTLPSGEHQMKVSTLTTIWQDKSAHIQ